MNYSNFCPNIPERFINSTLSDFDFSNNENLEIFIHNWINNHKKGIWLHGKTGVGKTMLLSVIYRIINCKDYLGSIFIYFPELIEQLHNYEVREGYISRIVNCDYIFIDDFLIGFTSKFYTVQDYKYLERVINEIYSGNKILICSSMYSKRFLVDGLESHDHMISRLVGLCEFIKVIGDDRRIR